MSTFPVPQRSLRGHRPQRPSQRTAARGEYVARIAGRLTERDRWLARMLHEHKVLTTDQITQLAWPSVRSARTRLLRLYKWRVVDRFQPFVTYGSAPMHYVLDVAGASLLEREDAPHPGDLNYRHDHAIGIAHSLRLAHTVATNTFFTTLVEHARRSDGDCQLTAWWSETRCRGFFGDIVRPDAYGRLRQCRSEVEWFLEYDWGTERPAERVGDKLPGYAHLAATTGITTPVLIWTRSAQHETRIRRALAVAAALLDDPSLVPLATTSTDLVAGEARCDPTAGRWLPLNTPAPDTRRVPLADLTHAWPALAPCTAPAPHCTSGTSTEPGSLAPPSPHAPNAYQDHRRRYR
ncbi:replication-relaxation family protein [Streptomyces sp. NPDC102360]|uniref:replication-relaxation family protein n=1 Tax=Streptomyces sp. NPDC102360 TaxID=3366160 RepID=UPI00382F5008